MKIKDYALIGNRGAAALLGRNGSIDWLCMPRFDSSACFAAILGKPENGRWLISPSDHRFTVERHYREGTTVLETEFQTAHGRVLLVDAMHQEDGFHRVLRMVRGVSGAVPMRLELLLRFDYGLIMPRLEDIQKRSAQALAGPDRFLFQSGTDIDIRDPVAICADFKLQAGEELAFSLTWSAPHRNPKPPDNVSAAIEQVTGEWKDWSGQFKSNGRWAEAELRSLVTIQALTHRETGGFVAAPTTSLPEEPGGDKNWDYRFCWLRDGAFGLRALAEAGFKKDAKAWRDWLLRAVAGSPDKLQIMYGLDGRRNLSERKLHWLDGFEGSKPVLEGNAASSQFQLDVYGQVLDIFYQARVLNIEGSNQTWPLEKALVRDMLRKWRNPGAGIWELRSKHQQFTESKVLAWAGIDRAIKSIENFGLDGPLDEWKRIRSSMHDEICRAGFNHEMNTFVQYYGGDTLDASLLLLPLFGFLPVSDPRMKATIAAIEKHLIRDGFVVRYNNYGDAAKPEAQEGCFIACGFWLVDNYILQGRLKEACDLFEKLLSIRNDVGLLSEEFDTKRQELIGNTPQVLSHAALITSAHNLNAALSGYSRGETFV